MEELKMLWNGVLFTLPTHPLLIRIRTPLLCIAADIGPATRRVCEFTDHNNTKGCSKCLKYFKIEPADYGGYDCDSLSK